MKSPVFGEALAAAFGESGSLLDLEDELIEGEDRDEEEDASEEGERSVSSALGRLQPLLGPWFPAWRNNLVLPEPERHEGTFVFRLSLEEMWRQIAISSEDTLDSLAFAILDSIKFSDPEHLYEFTYRDRFGLIEAIVSPDADGRRYTDEVLIGELPLQPGESMTFHFDFGDDWKFSVMLERIDPPNAKKKQKLPRVLAKHGKSPPQYESWDGW